MKLLILTQYYPPETGAPQNRLHDLARRLAGWGHQVEVLTALPNYPGSEILPAYVGRQNSVETLDGVRVARVGLYVPRRKTLERRMVNYLSFAANALLHGRRLVARADVVLVESPPLSNALPAAALARLQGAKLVTNVADYWPAALVQMGAVRPGPVVSAAERLEAWMYRTSDFVLSQTQGIVDDIKRRFPGVRAELYPNGVDLGAYRAVDGAARRETRARLGWQDDLVVFGYTGVLGYAQVLDQLVDAAERLRDEPRAHVALFGDGPCRDDLARRIDQAALRNIRLYGHDSREGIRRVQAAMDVGLAPLAKDRVYEWARPSKMFEFMALGLPLLVCARGEAAAIATGMPEGAAGLAVPPEDPDRLAEAMRRLVGDHGLRAELGRCGRAIAEGHFDRETIARRIEGILIDVVGQAPRASR